MLWKKRFVTNSIYSSFSVLVLSLFFVLAVCTHAWAQTPLSKEDAAKKVLSSTVERIWAKADKSKGLRVNQYSELLPKGAIVRPAFVPDRKNKEKEVLECKNSCWLFFLDEDPLAHFAHPVRIILVDAVTGEQQELATDWWPQIDGNPIFDKIKERSDPKNVIFDKVPVNELKSRSGKDLIGGKGGVIKSHDPCSIWAVIVCGYNDLPDTFDEDTDGIYMVLKGLGVPDDHIFFVSPHTTHPGVDVPTSIANVQWAINQVAAQADETDKVLFFYSSHGNVDSLSCVPGSPGGGSISAVDLSNWLSAITCQEMTIIIEACHSGSLIGRYADGTYIAAEDDLTGHGETNRAVFTSGSSDTSSYPDVDGADDPNPGDSGSETIWGYVEAFSTAAADTNGDGEISFGEAWQYAWNNDVTRIRGLNTPQMVHTGLNVNNVYNYCYRVSGGGDLFISDGPGDVGHNSYDYASNDIWVTQDPLATDHVDVVSGMDNYVHVTVHNRGTTSIASGSLKVYWGDVSTAMSWPGDFHQIGSTATFGPLASGDNYTHTWTWNVDPSIGLGHHFCLIAISDSPADPMTGGPAGITYVAPYDNNIGQKNITIVSHSGHGKGNFKFVLKNNTRGAGAVDLVIEWVGEPWGSATLILPEDLMSLVKKDKIKLENLRIVDIPGKKSQGLVVTGKTGGKVAGIPLKPGESRVVNISMQTDRTAPGQRSEIRLRQEAEGTIIGAVTVRMQAVSPFDCDWVTKNSVEAFADLAHELKIDSARKVSRLFAKEISNRVCCGMKHLMEVLQKALPMEEDVLKRLPRKVDAGAKKAFSSGVEELKKSIKARNVKAAVRAQGLVSDAATALLTK